MNSKFAKLPCMSRHRLYFNIRARVYGSIRWCVYLRRNSNILCRIQYRITNFFAQWRHSHEWLDVWLHVKRPSNHPLDTMHHNSPPPVEYISNPILHFVSFWECPLSSAALDTITAYMSASKRLTLCHNFFPSGIIFVRISLSVPPCVLSRSHILETVVQVMVMFPHSLLCRRVKAFSYISILQTSGPQISLLAWYCSNPDRHHAFGI